MPLYAPLMAIIPVRKAASAARAHDKLTETREISPSRAASLGALTREFRADLLASSVNSIRNFASNRVQADGDCNVQGMINFREYEPCVLSTYFVAGTDNSHDCLSKPSMKL